MGAFDLDWNLKRAPAPHAEKPGKLPPSAIPGLLGMTIPFETEQLPETEEPQRIPRQQQANPTPYLEGAQHFYAGKDDTANPYQRGSDKWFQWSQGHRSAATEREPAGQTIKRYAEGGQIEPGQLGIVGEKGPELVHGPAKVTSRQETAQILAQRPRKYSPDQGAIGFEMSQVAEEFAASGTPYRTAGEMLSDYGLPYGKVQQHGMTAAEQMQMFRMGDVNLLYTEATKDAAAQSLVAMAQPGKYPAAMFNATGSVVHTGQQNADDPFWRVRHSDKSFQSAATGGDGSIVVYGGGALDEGLFAHEAGHNVATARYRSTEPGKRTIYGRAAQQEAPVSRYARHSPAEDFAEAARLYVTQKSRLKREFPAKFDAMERTLGTTKKYDQGGWIPPGETGIVGERGKEIVERGSPTQSAGRPDGSRFNPLPRASQIQTGSVTKAVPAPAAAEALPVDLPRAGMSPSFERAQFAPGVRAMSESLRAATQPERTESPVGMPAKLGTMPGVPGSMGGMESHEWTDAVREFRDTIKEFKAAVQKMSKGDGLTSPGPQPGGGFIPSLSQPQQALPTHTPAPSATMPRASTGAAAPWMSAVMRSMMRGGR